MGLLLRLQHGCSELNLGHLLGIGHDTSKFPIDAIWASHLFAHNVGGEIQSYGNDHSIAWVTLEGSWTKIQNDHATAWKFKTIGKTFPCTISKQDAIDAWDRVTCKGHDWNHTLYSNVEEIWADWTADFQAFLVVALVRNLGWSMLVITWPQDRHTMKENYREKYPPCKRGENDHMGWASPSLLGLRRKLLRSLRGQDLHLANQSHWAMLEASLLGKSDDLHRNKTKAAHDQWVSNMSSFPHAVKWVKRPDPPSYLLESSDGSKTAGMAAGVRPLAPVWKRIFGCDSGDAWNVQKILDEYADDLPAQTPEFPLQPISAEELRSTTAAMATKATGLDQISAKALLSLPPDGWVHVAIVIFQFERLQAWSAALKHWKVRFIPKGSSKAIENGDL